MLLGNKSVRNTAGKAAGYVGAAVLGGLAYKAYQDWQQHNNNNQAKRKSMQHQQTLPYQDQDVSNSESSNNQDDYQVTLIKAMIASARADGQIDALEQQRISEAIDKMNLGTQTKRELLNLFLQPIQVSEIVSNITSNEQKTEIYLASCMAIELDDETEYAHLSK